MVSLNQHRPVNAPESQSTTRRGWSTSLGVLADRLVGSGWRAEPETPSQVIEAIERSDLRTQGRLGKDGSGLDAQWRTAVKYLDAWGGHHGVAAAALGALRSPRPGADTVDPALRARAVELAWEQLEQHVDDPEMIERVFDTVRDGWDSATNRDRSALHAVIRQVMKAMDVHRERPGVLRRGYGLLAQWVSHVPAAKGLGRDVMTRAYGNGDVEPIWAAGDPGVDLARFGMSLMFPARRAQVASTVVREAWERTDEFGAMRRAADAGALHPGRHRWFMMRIGTMASNIDAREAMFAAGIADAGLRAVDTKGHPMRMAWWQTLAMLGVDTGRGTRALAAAAGELDAPSRVALELREHGVDAVHARDSDGRSAMSSAVHHRAPRVLEYLARAGVTLPAIPGASAELQARLERGRRVAVVERQKLATVVADASGGDMDTSSIIAEYAGTSGMIDPRDVYAAPGPA